MALLSVVDASGFGGGLIVPAAATVGGGGDTVPGGNGVNLYVKAGGGAVNVVVTTPETVEGDLPVGDRTVAFTSGQEKVIPIPSRYNDRTTGLAVVTFSAAATVAAFKANTTA